MQLLTCPAPAREWYRTESGGWACRPWTAQGVRDVKSYGGWFLAGRHSFDSTATARLAGVRDES